MKIAPIMVGLAMLTTLSACATYDLSTAEGQAAYQRDLAYAQQIRARTDQDSGPIFVAPPPVVAPQIGPYGQPNNTAVVYCRDVTGNLITCKQIN